MDNFWQIFIPVTIIVIIYLFFFNTSIENLRIQGSHDIRGDPVIPGRGLFCSTGISPVGPFNVGSSCPIFNRQMDME